MRRIRPFQRDVELHGHHKACDYDLLTSDGYSWYPCHCAQLDLDDYADAVDRASHEMIENRERWWRMSDIDKLQDIIAALEHPQPDPDLLPVCIPPHLMEQQQTAEHLLRASLRLDDEIEQTKAKMAADMAAWQAVLAKGQEKREAWRAIVLAWMQRNNVTQLKTPWLTASITKGLTKKVVVDEAACIAQAKQLYPKAVKVVEKLDKKELDVAVDTFPKAFDKIVVEETGEPSLVVRRKD